MVLSWLVLPAAAAAQLGGLKKKIRDKVPGQQAQPAQGKTAPKCDASALVITDDVVARYLKSLAAGDAELAKLAKEPGDVGRYYTAYNRRRAVLRQREEFRLHRRPAWERYRERQKAIYKRLMNGDAKAPNELTALDQEVNPPVPDLPELAWESQQQGNTRVQTAMLEAGEFSECDWQRVSGDPPAIPMLTNWLVTKHEAKAGESVSDPGVPATAAEIKAVDARLPELIRALDIQYTTAADRTQLAADSVMLEKEAKQPIETGNPVTDCMNKANAEFLEKHKAELEAASKKKDQAEAMRLAQLQAKATAKCKPASNNDDDDD
jgi:hypothetical protein